MEITLRIESHGGRRGGLPFDGAANRTRARRIIACLSCGSTVLTDKRSFLFPKNGKKLCRRDLNKGVHLSSNMPVAIRIDGLGKKYIVGQKRERYLALRDVLTNAVRRPMGYVRRM